MKYCYLYLVLLMIISCNVDKSFYPTSADLVKYNKFYNNDSLWVKSYTNDNLVIRVKYYPLGGLLMRMKRHEKEEFIARNKQVNLFDVTYVVLDSNIFVTQFYKLDLESYLYNNIAFIINGEKYKPQNLHLIENPLKPMSTKIRCIFTLEPNDYFTNNIADGCLYIPKFDKDQIIYFTWPIIVNNHEKFISLN